MSQIFKPGTGGGGGGGIESLSSEGGAFTPPSGGNFNFSGSVAGGAAADGAILFNTASNGEMDAAVQVDGATIIINGSNQLQAVSQIVWQTKFADFTAAAGFGYLVSNAGVVNVTLPSVANVGDSFVIVEISTGTFSIVQNIGDTILIGSDLTTVTSGSATSTRQGDNLTLVCSAAGGPGNSWVAIGAVGNFVVV